VSAVKHRHVAHIVPDTTVQSGKAGLYFWAKTAGRKQFSARESGVGSFPRLVETARRHQSSAHLWNARTELERFHVASRYSKAVGITRTRRNYRHKQICKFLATQTTTSTLRLGPERHCRRGCSAVVVIECAGASDYLGARRPTAPRCGSRGDSPRRTTTLRRLRRERR
jgi:hypothetical protein